MKPVFMKRLAIFLFLCAVAAIAIYFEVQRYAHHSARSALDQFVETVPYVRQVAVGNMDVDIFGEGIRMTDVTVSVANASHPIHIHRVDVRSMDRNHPWPFWMHVEFHDIRFSPKQILQNSTLLHQLGYDALSCRLEGVYRYEHASKTLVLERFHFDIADAGSVTLSGRVGNIDLVELFSGRVDGAGIAGRLGGMLIEQGRLRYADASLFERVLQYLARASGLSTEAYRRRLVRNLSAALTADAPDNVASVTAGLSAFVVQPTQLVASVAPDRPVVLFWLLWHRNVEKLVDLLNLQVTTAPLPGTS